jgi:serine/threonine-protein kinase
VREAYAANAVGHPSVVKITDDDVDEEGTAFLVMELLEGESLEARRVRLGGRLPPREALRYMADALGVLATAHRKSIIHRDIKPANLFITADGGTVKMLDFGIAGGQILSPDTTVRTAPGAVLGTIGYMAPEQARARWELVDARTDIWAVGATVYTLLSGRFVHEASTPNEQLGMAMALPAGSLANVAPQLPKHVVELVDRALQYDPAARWQSAEEMQRACHAAMHALDALFNATTTQERPNDSRLTPTRASSTAGVTTNDRAPRGGRLAGRLPRRAIWFAALAGLALLFGISAAWRRAAPADSSRSSAATAESDKNVRVVTSSAVVDVDDTGHPGRIDPEEPPAAEADDSKLPSSHEPSQGRPSTRRKSALRQVEKIEAAQPATAERDAGAPKAPADSNDPLSMEIFKERK